MSAARVAGPSSALRHEEAPLVDVLDRLLERGAVIEGDLVLSLADVDLAWLGLRAAVGGIEHAPPGARLDGWRRDQRGPPDATRSRRSRTPADTLPDARPRSASPTLRRESSVGAGSRPGAAVAPASGAEDGLVRLVLSVVELVRQLMERQALRRVDDGSLSDEQIERLGSSLLRLSERMDRLKEELGLQDDDLQLNLGVTDAG